MTMFLSGVGLGNFLCKEIPAQQKLRRKMGKMMGHAKKRQQVLFTNPDSVFDFFLDTQEFIWGFQVFIAMTNAQIPPKKTVADYALARSIAFTICQLLAVASVHISVGLGWHFRLLYLIMINKSIIHKKVLNN